MSLPFSTFRQWSSGWGRAKAAKLQDVGDLEGDAPPEFERDDKTTYADVLRVAGDDVKLVSTRNVHPGDVLVIPCSRGGADAYGFKPLGDERVRDLSLLARDPDLRAQKDARAERRERVLVWTVAIAKVWLPELVTEIDAIGRAIEEEITAADAAEVVTHFLDAHSPDLPDDVRRTLEKVRGRRPKWLESEEGERLGIVLREGRVTADDLTEEGGGLQRSVRVSLAAHSRGVGELAEHFARSVGLEASLIRALRAAGATHDLGKADPRFQKRLNAAPGELLAKSDEYDPRIASGERHEVYSVALLDTHPHLVEGVEEHRELIRYLVGTHHGHGRAAHPIIDDQGILVSLEHEGRPLRYLGRPALHALGSGWAELFVRLNRTYGPWRLAFLEAILRLADHRRSEQEVIEAQALNEGDA